MKNVLVTLVVLVLGLLAFIASRPSTYHVERSASIAAPADSVYARMADFHRWNDWSPWAKLDPAMKTDYSGAESGTGAVYHWTGNDKVGEGRMTLTEAEAPNRIAIRLEFIKPFASVSATTFTLSPEAGGTHVVWAMDGHHNFISKAMCLVTSMDKMLGPDFEKGLATLKSTSEMSAAPAAPDSSAATATHS
jgi:Tfp pilus assembly protein PilV